MEQANSPASRKILPAFLAILIIAGLSAAAYYFVTNKDQADNETPPAITISTPKYQGLIQGDTICNLTIPMYDFTDAKVSAYVSPAADTDAKWYNLTKGVHFYHSDTDVTVKNILDNIKPVSGNKILVMHYPAADSNELKQFAAYPNVTGQINLTTDSIIPANEGIIIFACKDTKIYNIKDEITAGAALPAALTAKTKGWILLSAVNATTLKASLQSIKTKISAIWPAQLAGFDNDTFTKKFLSPDDANLPTLDATGNFRMVWVKIGTPTGEAVPSVNISLSLDTTANINTPDATHDFGSLNLVVSPEKDVLLKKIEFKLVNTDPAKPTDFSDFSEISFHNDGYILDAKLYKLAFDATSNGVISLPLPLLGITLNKNSTAKVDIKVKTKAAIKANEYKLEITKIEFDGTVTTNVTSYPVASAIKKVTPPVQIAAPVTITVAAPVATSDSVTFSWTDADTSGNVKKYLIFRSETSPVDTTQANFVGSNTLTKFTDNLTVALKPKPNTQYYYLIQGVDKLIGIDGNVLGTSAVFTVTTPAAAPASAPIISTGPVFSIVKANSAVVGWTATNTDPTKTKFVLSYKPGNCSSLSPAETFIKGISEVKLTVADSYSFLLGKSSGTPDTEQDLTPNTMYAVTIAASNDDGTTWPAITTCKTFTTPHIVIGEPGPTPEAPTDVTVTNITTTSAKVSWTAPADTLTKNYRITYRTGSCTSTAAAKYKDYISATSATMDGLSPNTEYSLTVATIIVDTAIDSPESTCKTFSTTPPKPTAPAFVETKSDKTSITWTSPEVDEDNGVYKTSYKRGGCSPAYGVTGSVQNKVKDYFGGYFSMNGFYSTTINGLTSKTKYGVFISASNDGVYWSENGACAEFTTTAGTGGGIL